MGALDYAQAAVRIQQNESFAHFVGLALFHEMDLKDCCKCEKMSFAHFMERFFDYFDEADGWNDVMGAL